MICNIVGGGSTNVNLKLKRYETKEDMLADTPRKNTIGVVSDTDITSLQYGGEEPTSPSSGHVIIVIDENTKISFYAEKDKIKVYPMWAKQYVNGAWVLLDLYLYDGSAWKYNRKYFMKDGAVFNSGQTTFGAIVYTEGNGYNVCNASGWNGVFWTADITPYSKIGFTYWGRWGYANRPYIGVYSTDSANNDTAYLAGRNYNGSGDQQIALNRNNGGTDIRYPQFYDIDISDVVGEKN